MVYLSSPSHRFHPLVDIVSLERCRSLVAGVQWNAGQAVMALLAFVVAPAGGGGQRSRRLIALGVGTWGLPAPFLAPFWFLVARACSLLWSCLNLFTFAKSVKKYTRSNLKVLVFVPYNVSTAVIWHGWLSHRMLRCYISQGYVEHAASNVDTFSEFAPFLFDFRRIRI